MTHTEQPTTIFPLNEVSAESWLRSYLFIPRPSAAVYTIGESLGFPQRLLDLVLHRIGVNGTNEVQSKLINGHYWLGFGDPSAWRGLPESVTVGSN